MNGLLNMQISKTSVPSLLTAYDQVLSGFVISLRDQEPKCTEQLVDGNVKF
jgi:hypothetical protein